MKFTVSVEILPGSGHARHLRLTTELAFWCRLHARRASLFAGKRIELVHHRVDGVFQFENFTLTSTVILRRRGRRAPRLVVTSAIFADPGW